MHGVATGVGPYEAQLARLRTVESVYVIIRHYNISNGGNVLRPGIDTRNMPAWPG